jgi:enoyl-CoA hydratase/carnithine racemase
MTVVDKDYKHLLLDFEDHVLTCRLSNPPKHTLNMAMLGEMNDLLETLENDNDVRVLVFTGAADGIFLRWFELTEVADVGEQARKAAEAGPDEEVELTLIQALGCRIEALPQVTIAAINGFAAGGACGLTLCFDFRLMMSGEPHYLFGSPQTTFGITTCGGQSVRYVRMLGTALSLDLLLHGKLLSPEAAMQVGLVSRVFPQESYFDDVDAFAKNLARRAPLALRGVKKLVRTAPDLTMHQGMVHEMVEYAKVVNSSDAKRAIAAIDAMENPDPTKFDEWVMDFEGR